MKRYPNPWFVVPVLAAAAVGAFIGRNLGRVSCLPTVPGAAEPCTGREVAFAVAGSLIAAVGVAVVIVLVIRSLGEWRRYQAGELEKRPEPGCEGVEDEGPEATPSNRRDG